MSRTTGIRRHNSTDVLVSGGKDTDAVDRVEVRADGSIVAGTGSAAPDATIRRAGVGSWAIALPITAGVPTDADFTVAPPNGVLAVNGGNDQVYYRKAGVWTQLGVDPLPPGAPATITAEAGDTQVFLNWSAAPPNGSTVTGYTWTVYNNSTNAVISTGSVANVLTKTVTGLTNGVAVYGKVLATNGVGPGPQSAQSNTVTPAPPTAPPAPTIGTATGGNTTATVTHTNNGTGGSPITATVITPYIAGVAQTAQTFNDALLTHTLTGLTNGTAYTFKVALTNSVGTGAQSAASNAVTPGVTTLFSDSFNRANAATLGAPWTNENLPGSTGTFAIDGNAATGINTSVNGFAFRDAGQTEHAIQVDVVSYGGEICLCLRVADQANQIVVSFANNGILYIYERRAGAHTGIGSVAHGITNGTNPVLKVKAAADVITAYINGVSTLAVTLSAPVHAALGANTKVGLCSAFAITGWNAGTFLDNALCTDV